MSHERITQLELSSPAVWDEVRTRTEALAAALAAMEGCERLRLIRVGATRAVLLVAFSDEAALAEITAETIDPWVEERLQPLLAAPPETVAGEAVVVLTRVRDDDWTVHDGLDEAERVDDFVRHVARTQTVWGLYGETWARAPRDDGAEALPFWPRMELAARCIVDEWADCSPRRIELEEFVEQWLGGMDEDGIAAVISPAPEHPGVNVPPRQLADALRAEVEQT